MKIRAAQGSDLDAIKTLLTESGLPASDVDTTLLEDFLVAENEVGKIVGSIGLERFGHSALVRSLVVAPSARNRRLSSTLLARAELTAQASGIRELWLLTTTAAGLFQRYGYTDADRSTAPRDVQGSAQFSNLCPASAACMRKVM
ncbi:arsenic resistance N-acetyltransferase ArsN2 [Caballeronia sp. LZ008]|uniref:arsenic resistance N-acetyltransferase ArsN2 n=1 Tax=unclassified Caballeronia TaxID=2646786 RepID=UPI00202978F1|nr:MULTISPECIES: arsenic resistance N-acetyltransferase ArsN2 [unclassified Caballeronia]MDR5794247.1 arsenic resistance N-acetyltransferase ArsN2 [Caballeronia sp. LZ008]